MPKHCKTDASPEGYIIVLGLTGAGKSSFIEKVKKDATVGVGEALTSCTQKSTRYKVNVAGKELLLVDTPGFDDTHRSNAEILREITYQIGNLHDRKVPFLGCIYLHPITEPRVGGRAMESFRILRELCGKDTSMLTMVTTKWDMEQEKQAVIREHQLRESDSFWGGPSGICTNGADLQRHYGNEDSVIDILARIIERSKPPIMMIEKEFIHKSDSGPVPLSETSVGKYLLNDYEEALQALRKTRNGLEIEFKMAKKNNDNTTVESSQLKLEKTKALMLSIETNKTPDHLFLEVTFSDLKSKRHVRDKAPVPRARQKEIDHKSNEQARKSGSEQASGTLEGLKREAQRKRKELHEMVAKFKKTGSFSVLKLVDLRLELRCCVDKMNELIDIRLGTAGIEYK